MNNEKYLIAPIIILALISAFVVLFASSALNSSTINGNTVYASTSLNPFHGLWGIGDITDLLFGFLVQNFMLSATLGLVGLLAIGMLVGLIGVGITVAALTVQGSIAVNDSTTMIIYKSVMFGAVWALLSVLSSVAVFSIPIVGWLIYLIISGVYLVGVMGQINSR